MQLKLRLIGERESMSTMFIDGQGNYRSLGESWQDENGNWYNPGEPFRDSRGRWVRPGDDFVDWDGNWRHYGGTFVDAGGNYVHPEKEYNYSTNCDSTDYQYNDNYDTRHSFDYDDGEPLNYFHHQEWLIPLTVVIWLFCGFAGFYKSHHIWRILLGFLAVAEIIFTAIWIAIKSGRK